MTVGELIKKLSAYDDEVEVRVQTPTGDVVWDMHPCIGEDEYEHVYIMTVDPPVAKWVAPSDTSTVEPKP